MSKPLIKRPGRMKKQTPAESSTDESDSDSGPELLTSRKQTELSSHRQDNISSEFSRRMKSTFPSETKSRGKRRQISHIESGGLETGDYDVEDAELSEEHVIKKKRKVKLKEMKEDVSSRKKIKTIGDVSVQNRLGMIRSRTAGPSGNDDELSDNDDDDDEDMDDDDDDDEEEQGSSDKEHAGSSGEGHSGIHVSSDLKEDNEEEMKAVKEELSHLSFEELQQLKEKLGTKVFNQVMHGKTSKPTSSEKKEKKKVFKRANKSRPMEMSSKKTVARYRQIIPVKKKIFRDPRFDDLSGEFSEEFFKKSYSFLDDVKIKEKQKLEKLVQKEKDPEKKRKIKLLLNRMSQQEQSVKDKVKKSEQEKQWAQREKDLVAQGKKPYFLKKSDKRKLELAEKYKELQESGKLEKYLSKKRKKNTQKERKRMPNRH